MRPNFLPAWLGRSKISFPDAKAPVALSSDQVQQLSDWDKQAGSLGLVQSLGAAPVVAVLKGAEFSGNQLALIFQLPNGQEARVGKSQAQFPGAKIPDPFINLAAHHEARKTFEDYLARRGEETFPRLVGRAWELVEFGAQPYNCVAHTVRIHNDWQWPSHPHNYSAYRGFIKLSAGLEIKPTDFQLSSGLEKVVLFSADGKLTHAILQDEDGGWSSKMGHGTHPLIRVDSPEAFIGPLFGEPSAVYTRARSKEPFRAGGRVITGNPEIIGSDHFVYS